MSSQPKHLNTPLRSPLRLDRVAAIIEKKLESEPMILDVLVTASGRGNVPPELWEQLHQAAARDNRIAELAFAYEQLVAAPKLKLLSGGAQADVLTFGATFFEQTLGDPEKAMEYLGRALAASPTHPHAFSRMEAILMARQDAQALVDFYSSMAGRRTNVQEQLALLRRAAELAEFPPGDGEQAIRLYHQIARLDPSDKVAIDALEGHYLRAGRFRDAAKWLEQLLASRTNIEPAEEIALRERLLRLYRDNLGELERALPHVERLLAHDPTHIDAHQLAEQMLENKSVASRAAAALVDSYESRGDFERAASMLATQLEHARGGRRLDMVKKLAALRQDRLGDPGGAIALLEEVVVAEIADPEVRQRYRHAAAALDRRGDAYRILSDAAANTKDPALRVRIQSELAQFSLDSGDREGARAAFEQVLTDTTDEAALLTAATGLASIYGLEQPDALAKALQIVVRFEIDEAARLAASSRLARLYQEQLSDPANAIVTWRTLITSPLRGEALDALERLYESRGLYRDVAGILELRAQDESDPVKARQLAFRAAEMRTSRLKSPGAAVNVWREFLRQYGPSREAHAHIIPLLEYEQTWVELAEVLKAEIQLADGAERIPLLSKLGQIAAEHLWDMALAIESFGGALALDPKDDASRKMLEQFLEAEGHRLLAAQVLEPVYRAEGNPIGLLKVLEARAQSTADVDGRLAIFEEVVNLLDTDLGESARALGVAGTALREVVAHGRPTEKWMNRVEELCTKLGDPQALGAIYLRALGDHPIDSPERFALARRAGDALLATGDNARALAVFRSALAFDSTSADLSVRVHALVLQQGSPAERISAHRASLERCSDPVQRQEIYHQIALIEERELQDRAAATATWRSALTENPNDIVAQQALFESYAAQGDYAALYAELERGLPGADGERRVSMLLKMAEAASQSGHPERALLHYRELLASATVSDEVLTTIERAAEAGKDAHTLRDVLERRIVAATDVSTQALHLQRLGDLQTEALADTPAALASWKRAVKLCAETGTDPERIRDLYAKIAAADPGDREASEKLVDLYLHGGDLTKLPAVYANLLRNAVDERQAINLVVAMEPWAARAGASREFNEAVDAALQRYFDAAARRISSLLSAKARVLAADSARVDEAAKLFRILIASATEDPQPNIDAFEGFLRAAAPSEARGEDERWLAAFRGHQLPEVDRAEALMAGARAHEAVGDRAAAIDAYRGVLDVDPNRLLARFSIVRLRSELGDVQGAFAALAELRDRSLGDVKAGVELQMGRLLAEKMDRPEEALETIVPVLDTAPDDATALFVIERALTRTASRSRAVSILERACEKAETPVRAARILRMLLASPADGPEFMTGRHTWFTRLLELQAAQPETGLDTSLRAVAEFPQDESFWNAAELFARALQRPGPVAQAYRIALEQPMDAPTAEMLGRRAVDFQEEWFEDPEAVIKLLWRVHELHGAGWAFDRLKLALNTQERYQDLFALYDRALQTAAPEFRQELLEEASEAAKDFARDADKAIEYLEQLLTVRPGHTATLAALERLYERKGRTPKLVALLAARLEAITDDNAAAQRTRERIASLCLTMGDRPQALRFVEEMLAVQPESTRAYELLARVVLPAASPPPSGSIELTVPLARRAAATLKSRYLQEGRTRDVVRVVEVELKSAENTQEQIELHRQLAQLRLESLADHAGAFENITALVLLEPHVEQHRTMLADLADRLDRHQPLAEVLTSACAACSDADLKSRLTVEAATVYRDRLRQVPRAIELFTEVVNTEGLAPSFVLATARQLEPLLASEGRTAERCAVLDKIAVLETDREARRIALGQVARMAAQDLHDQDRAARAWRERLRDDSGDREALDGLVEVLESARLWNDLIASLEARATQVEAGQARKDRGRIARIYSEELLAVDQAITAWNQVRQTYGPDDESFRELSQLLESAARYEDLATLVEEEARAAGTTERRVLLWGKLGDVCREHLSAPERAARSYAEALALDPNDGVARRGLSELEAVPEARPTVLAALARANVATGEWEQAAGLSASLAQGEEVPADIARAFWWGVGKFQRDIRRNPDLAEFALARALAFDENSAEILEALAAVQSRNPGRSLVLTMMRLSDVRGGDLQLLRDAAEVAIRIRQDVQLARAACEKVLELAISRWTASGQKHAPEGERSARGIAGWALRQLVAAAQEANDDQRAVELLKRGASLPFRPKEARRMKREVAALSAEKLKDTNAALATYRELFQENPGDEAAVASVDAFAALLDADRLDAELVSLWEQQAKLRADAGEPANAAALWDRAASLAEGRLSDLNRAIADHRQGAQVGGVSSLEALARIHGGRSEHAEAAAALERICELSPRDELERNALRLADAYIAAGQKMLARARLEHALQELKSSEALASKLARLYHEDEAWEALAHLLTSQAEQTSDTAKRLSYLVQAVELHEAKLGDAKATIPLLEQVIVLDPDHTGRRLALADALMLANHHDRAVEILEAQVTRFGSRKPKDRALVHFALARACKNRKRALTEVAIAARIDAGHPGILQALGRLAFQDGQLDLAEHTYQSLLLLYRGAHKGTEDQAGRAQLLLDLAEIAEKKGDEERAAELRASAKEATRAIDAPRSLPPAERTRPSERPPKGRHGKHAQRA